MLNGEAYAAYVFELLHDYLNKSNSTETFYSLVYLRNGSFVQKSISTIYIEKEKNLQDVETCVQNLTSNLDIN